MAIPSRGRICQEQVARRRGATMVSDIISSDIKANYGITSAKRRANGFTLIASLLLLLLLSGIAIGLMMMVNTEGKVGGTDLQNNSAYHIAEGGIEKMNSDLA